MNEHSELMDDLMECECMGCKNIWWVPGYDDSDLAMPSFCPFCGMEFNVFMEEE